MKKFSSDHLLSNTLKNIGYQLASSAIQIIMLSLVARIFGPEGNGQYGLAMLLPLLLTTILNLGISPANIYFINSQQLSLSEAWKSTLKLYIILSISGLCIGYSIITYTEVIFSGVPKNLLYLSLLVFPISLLNSFISGFFQATKNFKTLNQITFITPVMTFSFFFSLSGLRFERYQMAYPFRFYLHTHHFSFCL
ncbi:MAG: oligosaccharide flippase family protein [Candidatus Sericytochromatia bacterium]|nr:oligosaccharide flippase family protein [Candidatus Sericytochromatia bacterium]